MTMTVHHARVREFPVPHALRSALFGPSTTLDEMELVSHLPGDAGRWCAKVLARENDKLLDRMLGDDKRLPRGILAAGSEDDGDEIVVGLVNHDGQVWAAGGWEPPPEPVAASVDLDGNDVAYVARALAEGAESVMLRAYVPVAFVAAIDNTEPAAQELGLPDGAVSVAIVDPIDKSAVLELLAVAPGPKVFRRHDGQWNEDAHWVDVLRSVKPPPMVKLEGNLVASVASQVDAATAGQPFKPFEVKDAGMYRSLSSSAYVAELEQEALERGVALNLALIAAVTPQGIAGAERLKRYWMHGKGAAKIRWFTPGAWRRCYRHLVKYVGPAVAPGLCTNMSERLGGHGVATHVGD
jgi:hypothetical protein